MWITRENGKRLNVRRADFEALRKAIKEQNPKAIARETLRVVMNSKMAVRELTNGIFKGLEKAKQS